MYIFHMNINTLPNIGLRIRSAIAFRGRSQRNVATSIGLSANALSRIVRGDTEDPGASIIAALARELDISADYLLGLTSDIEAGIGETQPRAGN
jgi:transcriptional regulator with XRE-family HTH domain